MIRTLYVKDRLELVNSAIRKTEKFRGERDIALFLNSYLVVLISGIYEDCIEYLINQRAQRAGDAELALFVENSIGIAFRNPKYENLTTILSRFSSRWVRELNKKLRNEAKVCLNSLVNNKNMVAHGGDTNMTISEIKQCHKQCKSIFEKLEKIM